MADKTQTHKIKCPHCGWVRSMIIDVDDVDTIVVRGVLDPVGDLAKRLKDALTDTALTEANAWMDMPACSHCQKVYQYNLKTGEVKP